MAAYSYCIIALFLISPLNCYAENTTTIFEMRDEYNTVKNYVAFILFSLFLLYGIVSNVLIAIIFCSRNILYSREFILIVSQLLICSFLSFISQMTFVLPEVLKTKSSDGKFFHSVLHMSSTFFIIR
uniref:G-protein coupled receptors family 1 profile domain-containing protein n=1 Tax=Onchocerca volvulus TaxID=6282 RepID=A0A8R1XP71_ONCVO